VAKPATPVTKTPEQVTAHDDLDHAWKITARAIAADLPIHIPASYIRKALAANIREIATLVMVYEKYRDAMKANHPIPPEDPWASHERGCRARALGAKGECNCVPVGPLPPIPDQVYWDMAKGTFVAKDGLIKGGDFYASWYSRRAEFPAWA